MTGLSPEARRIAWRRLWQLLLAGEPTDISPPPGVALADPDNPRVGDWRPPEGDEPPDHAGYTYGGCTQGSGLVIQRWHSTDPRDHERAARALAELIMSKPLGETAKTEESAS